MDALKKKKWMMIRFTPYQTTMHLNKIDFTPKTYVSLSFCYASHSHPALRNSRNIKIKKRGENETNAHYTDIVKSVTLD